MKTRDKILALITENNEITTPEVAETIGMTKKGIEYHLTILRKEKSINHIELSSGRPLEDTKAAMNLTEKIKDV